VHDGLQSGDQISGETSTFEKLGPILASHVSVLPPESATLATATLHELGTWAGARTPGLREAHALVAIIDDYQNRVARNNLSQYRLGFVQITNGDGVADQIHYDCNAFAFSTRYLVP
jgi:hypothetical protein